jgi:hypothetical protein
MHRGMLVRVDVMERLPDGGRHVAEVKSSIAPKDYHVGDLATQVGYCRAAASMCTRPQSAT